MVLRRRKELIMWISNKIYQQVVVILFPSVRVRLCIIVLVLLCNVVMRNVGLPKSRSEIEQGLLEKKCEMCAHGDCPRLVFTLALQLRSPGTVASRRHFFFAAPCSGTG